MKLCVLVHGLTEVSSTFMNSLLIDDDGADVSPCVTSQTATNKSHFTTTIKFNTAFF